MGQELERLHACIALRFARLEPHQRALAYLKGIILFLSGARLLLIVGIRLRIMIPVLYRAQSFDFTNSLGSPH